MNGSNLGEQVSMGLNGSNQFRAIFARPHAIEVPTSDPSTLHPAPSTLNPQPSTLNPEP